MYVSSANNSYQKSATSVSHSGPGAGLDIVGMTTTMTVAKLRCPWAAAAESSCWHVSRRSCPGAAMELSEGLIHVLRNPTTMGGNE